LGDLGSWLEVHWVDYPVYCWLAVHLEEEPYLALTCPAEDLVAFSKDKKTEIVILPIPGGGPMPGGVPLWPGKAPNPGGRPYGDAAWR